MAFEIVGPIEGAETFAKGSQIREIARLRKAYGKGNWRKRKGIASVRLSDGAVRRAELHWYWRARQIRVQDQGLFGLIWQRKKTFVVCISNEGYEASLERLKIYQTIPDRDAAKHGQVRVIDESGEDYLYPAAMFTDIELTPSLRRAVLADA